MDMDQDIGARARALHDEGFNCAQSVLCVVGEELGLSRELCLALAGGFGGGLRCGEICGAVSGAVMALGVASPYTDATDARTKALTAAQARECCGAFRKEFGALRCQELVRPQKITCPDYIDFCARWASDRIRELKEQEK